MKFNPLDYLIFEGIVGSRLYGLATEDSDTDYRGVAIPPMSVILDLFNNFEVKDDGFEEGDRAIYSLGKFFQLCANSNPNIIEILFIPEDKTVRSSKKWEIVKANRNVFLSKKAKYTFTGYAFAQLKKLQSHRRLFLNPPSSKPERRDYGLSESPILSYTQITSLDTINPDFVDLSVRDEIIREKNYRADKKSWDDYVSWRENRNPRRRVLEEKYGYDTKWAAHVFRLMTEGKELLLTGNITFPLTNADEILEIKHGKYSYDELITRAESLERDFETWYSLSPLRNKPDQNGIQDLYENLVLN